jgi:hypothetical protein
MSSADILSQRFAVMGVGNIAANLANQKQVLEDGALAPMLQLARLENGDIECQRYATMGLTNLAATKANHPILLEAGAVQLMRRLIDHPDVEASLITPPELNMFTL